jgi:predicted dehydrogenase
MMRYLGGEIDSVFCWQDLRILDESDTDCPDVNVLSLRFKSGALGTFSCTWALDAGDWTNANIVEMTWGDSRLRWKYGELAITKGGQTSEETGPNGSIDDVFVNAVATGDRSAILSDYDEGLRTLAVSLAADESARTGKVVNIDEFIAQQR